MINKSIFKSYDIRGIYPTDLNELAAEAIGKAFIRHTKAKKVVVGFDARLSSPALYNALSQGIILAGADVCNIGMVPTECLYFAVTQYDFDAGIMITASHNPKEYNGFKMMQRKKNSVVWIRGKDLVKWAEKDLSPAKKQGIITEKNVLADHQAYVSTFIGNDIKPFKVVIDASNGVVGPIIKALAKKLPLEIIELNFNPNGNFPNHSPNPLEEESVRQIKEVINTEHADFGIMFDGDADRVFLVDEQGELLSSDVTRLLLAKYCLEKNPGAAIVYDAIASRAVPEFITQWGGVPVKAPVGFVNIREALIKHKGIMGGEVSGHYCFRDYFYMDSGLMAFVILLEVLSKEQKTISTITKELSPYAKSPVINFTVAHHEHILAHIKKKYAGGKKDYLDGITVAYKEWWFNLRPSNTEPLLKLTVEATTQELLEQKKKELSEFIIQD